MNWYMSVIKDYAVFSGRARRKEYWMFLLFNIIIAIAIGFIDGATGGDGVIGIIYSLAVLIPHIAVSVRRLHDTNRSGWWLLLVFIPLLGGIIILIFLVLEGDSEENRYGKNPKLLTN